MNTRDANKVDLSDRVRELEAAIEKHRSRKGNDLCWENDVELWAVLNDDKTKYPHDTLLPKNVFLSNCEYYYNSRVDEAITKLKESTP